MQATTPLPVHATMDADYAWTEAQFSPTTDMYSSAQSPAHATTASDGNGSEDSALDSALALRRQRNRESMRRTRLKSKEAITQLRSTLTKLETQYNRLMAPQEASSDDYERHKTRIELQTKLQELVVLRRSLEADNVAVQQVIEHKQALDKQLQLLLDTHALDEMVNEKLALLESSCVQPRECFTSLTVAQSVAIIDQFCGELDRIKAESAAARVAGTSPPPLDVFGWQARRHVDATDTHMHFAFVKVFDHVDAHAMTDRAWRNGMDVDKFRATERQLNIRRLDFLQHVTADTKVMVREIVHPVDGTVFRTNYLTFKRAVRDGFLVGMVSLNPPPAQQHEHAALTGEQVMWVDVNVSVELVASGPHACRVSWRGSTNYKSRQYAAESAVKFLMGVLRWEYVTVGPTLQFLF